MLLLIKVFIISLARWATSTTAGLSFMDKFVKPYRAPYSNDNNPCNPLYWYPKDIPDYCYPKAPKDEEGAPKPPVPLPIPVPMPPPLHLPIFPPPPIVPPIMPPLPPLPPSYMLPHSPPPFGMPFANNPVVPGPGLPYPYYPPMPYPAPYMYGQKQVGMVPGIPGLVTPDGGINILPFSDVYSDLLKKHKERIFRKQYQHLYDKYESYPRAEFRRHRKHRLKHY